ncbi:Alkaline phosphatase synthesis sensor protein PhoR [compost metagenome]
MFVPRCNLDLPDELVARLGSQAEKANLSATAYLRSLLERDANGSMTPLELAPFLMGIYKQTSDAVFVKDLEGRYRFVNPAGAALVNRSPDEVLGKRDPDLFDAESAKLIRERDAEVLATRQATTYEEVLTTLDGTRRVYLITKFPYQTPEGRIEGIAAISREITDRHRNEDAFRELAQGLSATTGSSFFSSIAKYLAKALEVDIVLIGELVAPDQDVIRTVTLVAKGQVIDNMEYQLTGTPCENVVGRSLCSYVRGVKHLFPNDRELQEFGIEGYVGIPLFDLEGRALGLIAAMNGKPLKNLSTAESLLRIVAKRVEAELIRDRADQAIKQMGHTLELILNSAGDGIFGVAPSGKTTLVNPAAARMLGYPPESLMGLPATQILRRPASDSGKEALHPVEQVLRSGASLSVLEDHFLTQDGTALPVEYTITPIREGTTVSGAVVTFKDISERKKAESAIARQQAELLKAKELDELKSNFVNSVTHELRTPLTSIMGYAEFLEDEVGGKLAPAHHEFVRQIQKGSRRLEYLLNDLLDFARLEAGTFSLICREADFSQLVDETVASFKPEAMENHLELEASLPAAPLVVRMDPQRITQVLANLIHNAAKFTPSGGRIRVLVRQEGDRLRCEVQDSGIGIAPEDLPKLFQRFTQLKDGRKKGVGTGLGLSISKTIVEAHGGSIGVKSQPNAGSVFWFTLPNER